MWSTNQRWESFIIFLTMTFHFEHMSNVSLRTLIFPVFPGSSQTILAAEVHNFTGPILYTECVYTKKKQLKIFKFFVSTIETIITTHSTLNGISWPKN